MWMRIVATVGAAVLLTACTTTGPRTKDRGTSAPSGMTELPEAAQQVGGGGGM
jgi:hypothetical protein